MKKNLVRSSTDRKISGVCGGLGDYLNIDSTLVRITFVLFTFAGGFGLLLYIVAILLMPMDYEVSNNPLQNTTYATTKPSDAAQTVSAESETQSESDSTADADNDSNTQTAAQPDSAKKSSNTSVTVGIVLIAIGLVFLAKIFFPQINFSILFAAGIIAMGVLFIARGGK